MLPQIYLVRHGETEWSRSAQHTSSTDLPLTPQGEQEARGLQSRLNGVTFSTALSSPRRRARQTALLAGLGALVRVDTNLREWEYGSYEGLTSAAIAKMQPGWNLFRDGAPGGETPAEVSGRADQVVARLRELQGNIAVFSHGHFLRVLAVRWLDLPVIEAQHFALGTASIGILGFEHGHLDQPVITLWNERREG